MVRTAITESRRQPVHVAHALAFTGFSIDRLVAIGLVLVSAGFYGAPPTASGALSIAGFVVRRPRRAEP